MTTAPAPATPENSPSALVVAISTKSANPVTGRPGATIFSIQNPDGSFWANRRGRRRAWTSKKSAIVARYTETNAARAAKGLARLPLGEFPDDESVAPPAPPAVPPTVAPSRYSTATIASAHRPKTPAAPPDYCDRPRSAEYPSGERVGKLVAAAIAIDPRIARSVMDVVSSMIRTK